jgi:hypothetical protein
MRDEIEFAKAELAEGIQFIEATMTQIPEMAKLFMALPGSRGAISSLVSTFASDTDLLAPQYLNSLRGIGEALTVLGAVMYKRVLERQKQEVELWGGQDG